MFFKSACTILSVNLLVKVVENIKNVKCNKICSLLTIWHEGLVEG